MADNNGHGAASFNWRHQLFVALLMAALVAFRMGYKQWVIPSGPLQDSNILFSPIPGILLAWIILRRGAHLATGVFAGGLVTHLLFAPSAGQALIFALDETAYVVLAGLLLRWAGFFSLPRIPGARFLSMLVVVGGVVPTLITSLPTCWLIAEARFGSLPFRDGYLQWCLGEIKGELVLTPFVLLLGRRGAIREHLQRPWELVLLVGAELIVMKEWTIASMLETNLVMASVAGWGVTLFLGFCCVIRCGVGGVIVANVVIAIVMGYLQVHIANTQGLPVSDPLLVGFYAEVCIIMSLMLVVAGGFYDYKRAEQALHSISGHILNTQEGERHRLSANLHDGALQTITAALRHLVNNPRWSGEKEIQATVQGLQAGIRELRDTIVGLRPEMLEQSTFAEVLNHHCEQTEVQANVDVLFFDEAEGLADNLSLHAREHLFRLAQEAISNAVRHGQALHVEVTLTRRPGSPPRLRLEIADDGKGFDPTRERLVPDRPHLGLRVMQERALLIDGRMNIDSTPGAGTRITIELPVPQVA